MESGPFDNYTVQVKPEDGFMDLADRTGCSVQGYSDEALACLRKLPLEADLPFRPSLRSAAVAAADQGYFSPVIDGVELVATPEVLAATGRTAPIQGVIIGTNRDEGRLMLPSEQTLEGAPFPSKRQFHEWLETMWPGYAEEIAARYPPASAIDPAKYWKASVNIYTDAEYLCPSRSSGHWLLRSGKVAKERVFIYRMMYEPSYYVSYGRAWYWWYFCKMWVPCSAMSLRFGAAHGAEVAMVWAEEERFNETDARLAKLIVTWWQQFAESFNPGQAGNFVWPSFSPGNVTFLVDPDPSGVPHVEADLCDFWDWVHSVPYPPTQHKNQQEQREWEPWTFDQPARHHVNKIIV